MVNGGNREAVSKMCGGGCGGGKWRAAFVPLIL